jgi:hypothetical protein
VVVGWAGAFEITPVADSQTMLRPRLGAGFGLLQGVASLRQRGRGGPLDRYEGLLREVSSIDLVTTWKLMADHERLSDGRDSSMVCSKLSGRSLLTPRPRHERFLPHQPRSQGCPKPASRDRRDGYARGWRVPGCYFAPVPRRPQFLGSYWSQDNRVAGPPRVG